MLAQFLAVATEDGAGLTGFLAVFLQKAPVIAVAQEAQILAFALAGDGQAKPFGQFAYFWLGLAPDGEEHLAQFFLIQHVQDVRLIFVGV